MRRAAPCSAVVQYPYENDHGVMHYPQKLTEEMEQFLLKELAPYIPEEKIFRWEERE
jgi:spore photoproduct lyase